MSADYHEFGMNMEGRGFSGSLNYRFGYQGSEKDNEVNSSNGSSYTTEFRQLDTRLGRWFSSDPVFQPWQSSYTSMDNNPVNLTDVLGLLPDGDTKNEDSNSNNNTDDNIGEIGYSLTLEPIYIIFNSKPSDQKTEQTSPKKNWLQRTWEKTKKVAGGIYNSIANNRAHELIQQNGLEDVFYRDDPSSISVQGETLLQYVTQEVNRANKLNEQLLNYILRRSLQDKDFYSSMLNSPAVSDELKSQLLINKIHQTTGAASEIILDLGTLAIPIEGALTVVLKPIGSLLLKGSSRLLMTKNLVTLEIVAIKATEKSTKLLTQGWVPNAGGSIISFTTKETSTYFRVYSGNPNGGAFLTKLAPKSSAFAVEGLALPPTNTASFIQRVTVPSDVILQRSRALGAFGRRGGLEQFQILNFDSRIIFHPGFPLW